MFLCLVLRKYGFNWNLIKKLRKFNKENFSWNLCQTIFSLKAKPNNNKIHLIPTQNTSLFNSFRSYFESDYLIFWLFWTISSTPLLNFQLAFIYYLFFFYFALFVCWKIIALYHNYIIIIFILVSLLWKWKRIRCSNGENSILQVNIGVSCYRAWKMLENLGNLRNVTGCNTHRGCLLKITFFDLFDQLVQALIKFT